MESDRAELYNWIAENHSDLNVLVNNAGIQNWMNISDDDFYQKANDEVTTNVLAPVPTTLFTNLKSVNTIINVTSALAFIPFKSPNLLRYESIYAFFYSFFKAPFETKRH